MRNTKFMILLVLLLTVFTLFAISGCSSPAAEEPAAEATTTAAPATEEPMEQVSDLRPEGLPADWPSENIEYVYGFSPGSVQDIYIRMIFDWAAEHEGWEKDMVIDYREGAGGRISWSATADEDPDGYTIGFAPSAMLISAVAEDLSYKHDNLSYIFNMMSDPGLIGVAFDSEFETLQDLIDAALAAPGTITVGVTSTIGQEGLTMKQIAKLSGADFNVVAFDGGASVITQIMGGHVDAFCLNVSDATSFIADEAVKPLATGDSKRSQFLPDVPTYQEAGYNVTQVNMRAVAGPKDMPEPIRQYLENVCLAAAADPEIQAKAMEMQIPLDTLTGAQVKEVFTSIGTDLQNLWDEEPWN